MNVKNDAAEEASYIFAEYGFFDAARSARKDMINGSYPDYFALDLDWLEAKAAPQRAHDDYEAIEDYWSRDGLVRGEYDCAHSNNDLDTERMAKYILAANSIGKRDAARAALKLFVACKCEHVSKRVLDAIPPDLTE